MEFEKVTEEEFNAVIAHHAPPGFTIQYSQQSDPPICFFEEPVGYYPEFYFAKKVMPCIHFKTPAEWFVRADYYEREYPNKEK